MAITQSPGVSALLLELPSTSDDSTQVAIDSLQTPTGVKGTPHAIVNLDELSMSGWLREKIVSPTPPVALPVKLPHFLPAGVTVSSRLIPLSLILRDRNRAGQKFSEDELVCIAVQLLDAVAASYAYGRVIDKELAGGFLSLETVMTDEQRRNYYLVGCRYGLDKTTHTLIQGRNGILESLYFPPWSIPCAAELRQGATTRGAFGRIPATATFWSLAILLCECIILKPLPIQHGIQQLEVYRGTNPAAIANMVANLAKFKGFSAEFSELLRNLMLCVPSDASQANNYLQSSVVKKYIEKWKKEGRNGNVVERIEGLCGDDAQKETGKEAVGE